MEHRREEPGGEENEENRPGKHTGSFAEGEETLPRDEHVGSYADSEEED